MVELRELEAADESVLPRAENQDVPAQQSGGESSLTFPLPFCPPQALCGLEEALPHLRGHLLSSVYGFKR